MTPSVSPRSDAAIVAASIAARAKAGEPGVAEDLVPSISRDRFQRIDQNHDGYLNAAELTAEIAKAPPEVVARAARSLSRARPRLEVASLVAGIGLMGGAVLVATTGLLPSLGILPIVGALVGGFALMMAPDVLRTRRQEREAAALRGR